MTGRDRVCVVVPAFNEGTGLLALHARLSPVLERLACEVRLLFVDDGSSDDTWAVIQSLVARDPTVSGLRLSRNFGKEIAMTAGLDAVDADAVVLIDADLQDPPELIPVFVERWREGHDVVFGRRTRRQGEGWVKRATASGFYRLMERLSQTPIPRDTGDFRLLSRRAVEGLRGLRERHRFMKGLFTWVGYNQCAVDYERDPRHSGTSKFNYWKLWNFALEGITGFSTLPLRLATYIGVATAVAAFLFGGYIIAKTLLWGEQVPGYPSLMTVMLFLGGIQLMALGVIGEYLGRLYQEAKQRPLYLVDRLLPAAADQPGAGLPAAVQAAGVSSGA